MPRGQNSTINLSQSSSQTKDANKKPLCLLDIDGVLNCFGGTLVVGNSWEDDSAWEVPIFDADGFKIRVPKGTKERLKTLAEYFEMVWTTTWEDRAHPNFGKVLELGEAWPVISFSNIESAMTWKLPAVKKFVGERPAIWIDDDLEFDAYVWAKNRNEKIPTALIQTNPAKGLTQIDLEKATQFANQLK